MARLKSHVLAVLLASTVLQMMVVLDSLAQLRGRREASGEIYAAPASKDCDPGENGALKPPYQLWREAEELRSELTLTDPRRIAFSALNRDRVGFPSDGPRVDGLYFSELKQVLLVPTQGASGTPRRPEDDGIPCRYLVMGGSKSARGIFRSLASTANSNRYVAVKAGSILDVWPAAPEVLSTQSGRSYISVDVENSCYQPDSSEDAQPPKPGIFYLETEQDLIAKPIAWCDPEELRKLAPPPPPPPPPTTATGNEDRPATKRPPLPDGYRGLGQLDELADIFNALGHSHGVPPVTALAFRCTEHEGRLDFWIGLPEETSLPGSLPEPFGVLAAQMVDVDHGCQNVRKITWYLESAPKQIGLEVTDPASLGFEWVHGALARWAAAEPEATAWKALRPEAGSQQHVAALYHRLTAHRPDLPQLESWRDESTNDGDGLRIYMKIRGEGRFGLERLLCAHLAAASPACRRFETLICYATTWTKSASLDRGHGCLPNKVWWALTKDRRGS